MTIKLSQLTPEVTPEGKSIRIIIPVFINDGEKIISEKVTIYNIDDATAKELTDELEDKEDSGEILFHLIKYCTDIEVDYDSLEEFSNFLKIFNETNKAIQSELNDILIELYLSGMEKMEKFMSLPDEKKVKRMAVDPDMRDAYTKFKKITDEMQEPEIAPTEEELGIMRKAEKLKVKYQKE